MANISKPTDINKIWAASGDVLAPSDTKISQGWQVEIPPRQYFNYIDKKQDQAIAHINQYGIALWDGITEYQYSGIGGKSLVMGSNGVVYRAKQVNTNQNPVTDTTNIYWEVAFATAVDIPSVATAAQARAFTVNNVYMSPLQVANAFTGSNQSLSGTGFQKFPGGFMIACGLSPACDPATGLVTVNLGTTFSAIFSVVALHYGTDVAVVAEIQTARTMSSVQFKVTDRVGATAARNVSYQVMGAYA